VIKRKGLNARASAATTGAFAEAVDDAEEVGNWDSKRAGSDESTFASSTSTGAMRRRGRRSSAKLMRWPTRIASASEDSDENVEASPSAVADKDDTDFVAAAALD
jgi:hypothetical protein